MKLEFLHRAALTASCIALLSLSCQTSAQTLPRKAMLGVAAKPLDVAAAKAAQVETGSALELTQIIPNGSLDAMGLKVGDVLLSINKKSFASMDELLAFAQTLTAGDAISVDYVSQGKRQNKQGLAVGKPRETSQYGEVRHDAVDFSLGTLRTLITLPQAAVSQPGKRWPTIFWLQGYTCSSQEVLPGSTSAGKLLREDWVKAGYVVYLVERPNLGDSRTVKDCRDTDFDEEMAVNIAAYKKLLTYSFVDTDNLFFFGHSMGSVTAPLVAQVRQPKGIMTYGVILRSWFEYFIDIARVQNTYFGQSRVAAEKVARDMIPLYYAWLEKGLGPRQWQQDPKLKAIIDANKAELEISGDYVFGRHYNFWHTMNMKRNVESWSRVNGKVLAIYGEFDVHAISPAEAQGIAAVVNENHPGNGEYLLIPGTEHGFLKAQSYSEVTSWVSNPAKRDKVRNSYNPEVGRLTLQWLEKLRKN